MTKQEFLRLNSLFTAQKNAPRFNGISKREAKNKRFSVHRKCAVKLRKKFIISSEIACPWAV